MRRLGLICLLCCPLLLPAGDLAPGTLTDRTASFQFAVYFLPASPPDLDRLLRSSLRVCPGLRLASDGDAPLALLQTNLLVLARSHYDPPDEVDLREHGHGLSREHIERLRRCEQALQVDVRVSNPLDPRAHREVHAWMSSVARETGGLIWDEETQELFAPDAWDARRALPEDEVRINLLSQTLLRIRAQPDGLLRAVSLGMRKFGLPDVVLDNLPRAQARQGGRAVNAVALALASGAALDPQGRFNLNLESIMPLTARKALREVVNTNASPSVIIELRPAGPLPDDPDNRLVEISMAPYFGNDETARLTAMLYALFGGEDAVLSAEHTPAVLAASALAREQFPQWRKRLRAGLSPGELLCVKVPFLNSDNVKEMLWIEVLEWSEDGKIAGILQNEPRKIPSLQQGQQIPVREADVFDVIFIHRDGTFEGNETGRLLMADPAP